VAFAVMDHIDSEQLLIIMGMVKGTTFVVGLNHIFACSWFGVSQWSGSQDVDQTWVTKAGFQEDNISDFYRYLTSLHWSLTQFTPASMEVVPCNQYERAFAVCVLIFALLVFSSFLSSITSSMTQLRQLGWTYQKNLSVLRKFLHTNKVSNGLSVRVIKYVEHRLSVRKAEMRESDVPLLGTLSSQLVMELQQELRAPILRGHPFFKLYADVCPDAMREVCYKAITSGSFLRGDNLFLDMPAESMIFLAKGRLEYVQAYDYSIGLDDPEGVIISEGGWVSELAMWVDEWDCCGELFALDISDVLYLDGPLFVETSMKFREVFRGVVKYANSVLDRINNRPFALQGLSDANYLTIQEIDDLAFGALSGSERTRQSFSRFYKSKDPPLQAVDKDAVNTTSSSSIEVRDAGDITSKASSVVPSEASAAPSGPSLADAVEAWHPTAVQVGKDDDRSQDRQCLVQSPPSPQRPANAAPALQVAALPGVLENLLSVD